MNERNLISLFSSKEVISDLDKVSLFGKTYEGDGVIIGSDGHRAILLRRPEIKGDPYDLMIEKVQMLINRREKNTLYMDVFVGDFQEKFISEDLGGIVKLSDNKSTVYLNTEYLNMSLIVFKDQSVNVYFPQIKTDPLYIENKEQDEIVMILPVRMPTAL